LGTGGSGRELGTGVERFSKSAAATFVAILVCRDFHKIFSAFINISFSMANP